VQFRRRHYRAFIAAALVGASWVSVAAAPLRVSLCDLVRTPHAYDAKMVEVDAQTGGDWFEYAPLFDSSCPGSVIQLREGRN